jgi:hypothetical protein
MANVAQFKQGANQCSFYLSVDHHQSATYSLTHDMWHFRFEDGEFCQIAQTNRSTDIYYMCDAEQRGPAWFFGYEEFDPCDYILSIHSPLACVPENQFNANCQWRIMNSTAGANYTLDLSSLKGQVVHARSNNGYDHYYTPCQNGLYCHQQYGPPVMSIIENQATGTCDHYLAVWEAGREHPTYHPATGSDPTQAFWQFAFWNGQKCSNGQIGEETVNYYCDPTVPTVRVISEVYDGNCFWTLNLASALACNASEEMIFEAYKSQS